MNKSINFDALRLSIASPEKIMQWSHGEVTKPETINYRTQKPERDGLFCEKIFGPIKDWECYCGKYKKIRYKGVICDKCGVEVTRSAVRRERMGHIDLACPVAHIWYVRGIPSVLSLALDMSLGEIEKVIYFAAYVILEVNEEIKKSALLQLEKEYKDLVSAQKGNKEEIDAAYKKTKTEIEGLAVKKVISETYYYELSMKYGQIIRVGIGAEALHELLAKINLKDAIEELKKQANFVVGAQKRRILKQLRLFINFYSADIKPQWLVLSKIPIIPPDLRPLVQLDGGRFAASDLNDLYRRVINRNNRLKKLISQGAPEVICRNEKRMLQEAVDALIDNSARRGKVVSTGAAQRKLRSLSDMLRGKQGRFRQNLLGKRVDYSGRSVIVVGPNLKLNQAGIPKTMALELFKPFVISKLLSEGFVHNVKNASKMIEDGAPEVWDILEKVTKDAYVLLNRAPTLHRLGIQGFQPVLIEGKAIQIHPLVCMAFNADFDGDQMAVHVPLSKQAKYECSQIMRSSHNLLKPASGEPVVTPRLDMVFGAYYLTSFEPDVRGEGKIFGSKNEAILAYQYGLVHLRAKIKVKLSLKPALKDPEQLAETSIGRILFNNELPKELRFKNEVYDAKSLKKLIKECFDKFGIEETANFVDRVKKTGFSYATLSGMTISMDDIHIPVEKRNIISEGNKKVEQIETLYRRGLINNAEKVTKSTELWMDIKKDIENNMIADFPKNNPVYIMVSSGARGTITQLTQMAGMKGLVVNPSGEIIETPIKANFKEGLSVLEYFISTHAARKGRSDTALRTSDAGYLTRRLVDVSQDLVISEEDCHTKNHIVMLRAQGEELGLRLSERIRGRVAALDIKDPQSKRIIVKANQEITNESAAAIEQSKIEAVPVFSVLTCDSKWGVCQKCYGRDLAKGKLAQLGEVVGIMAAQAIGEPGTQLTLKTFHMGGVTGEDITTGLPRVEELFEARMPRTPAVISEIDGVAEIRQEKDQKIIRVVSSQTPTETYNIEQDYAVIVKNGDLVKAKQALATYMK
ncbi:MAG: DNA-directed RNA polymerase subunit beta', partial [Patescibacteria group bacterium]|nr:DNA-directed RNA polymerase subunit beta' [Patescibacteria group bacterium]